MRRPDMSGDKHGAGTGFQCDFEQIPAVQAQDGTAVGMQVPDLLQPLGKAFRLLESGKQEQVVYLADPAVLFVNRADLPRDDEPGPRRRPVRLTGQTERVLERIQAVLGGLQLLPQLIPPGRMGEVPRPDHVEPLAPRPCFQMLRHTIPAGRAGITGMDMQIRQKHPFPHFLTKNCLFPIINQMKGKGNPLYIGIWRG